MVVRVVVVGGGRKVGMRIDRLPRVLMMLGIVSDGYLRVVDPKTMVLDDHD